VGQVTNRPDRDDILAWVDERASGEQGRRVEAWLAQDAEARDEALAWRAQAQALAGLGKEVLDEPAPERLLEAATGAAAGMGADAPGSIDALGSIDAPGPADAPRAAPGAVRGAAFAGPRFWLAAESLAALAWAVGWLSHARFGSVESPPVVAGPDARGPASGDAPPGFVRDAVAAHAVFVPEVRHPVEVAAAQHEHLVQWLSKRLGARLTVPSLDA